MYLMYREEQAGYGWIADEDIEKLKQDKHLNSVIFDIGDETINDVLGPMDNPYWPKVKAHYTEVWRSSDKPLRHFKEEDKEG